MGQSLISGVVSSAAGAPPADAFARKTRLVTGLREGLPTLPTILFGLNRRLERPEDFERAEELIALDPSLSSQVLRLANTLPQTGKGRTGHIHQAVKQIGRERMGSMALTSELLETAGNRAQQAHWQAYWQHSGMAGLLCRQIARCVGYDDSDLAYAAGLLHDIGILAFLSDTARTGEMPPAEVQHESALEAQRQHYGLDHCELGRWVGISWNFPAALVEACAQHHEPSHATQDPTLTGIVAAADKICEAQGITACCAPMRSARPAAGQTVDILRMCLPGKNATLCAAAAKEVDGGFRSLVLGLNQRFAEC